MVKVYAFDSYSHSDMKKFRDKWMHDLSCVVCDSFIKICHVFKFPSSLAYQSAVFLGGDESGISIT